MKKNYRTSNLAIAAYLVAGRHLALSHVDAADPSRVEFVFNDPEAVGPALEAAFLTADAQVPAAAFHRQLRALRRLIEEKTLSSRSSERPGSRFRGYEHASSTR